MFSTGSFRRFVCAGVMLAAAGVAHAQTAPSDATLYRIFLRDGTTLVSYGEFARVANDIVLSLPVGGTTASPSLQLLSIPADSVDWEKTDAYMESARAARYAATSGPNDYALLTESVTRALGDIALTPDPARKIAMAAEARQNVMKWTAEHYGYQADGAAHLASLFDDVIAETRGIPRYELALVAPTPAPPSMPLQPAPSLRESIEQALRAASLVGDSADRTSVLRALQQTLGSIPEADWVGPVRMQVSTALAAEERIDHRYASLTQAVMRRANNLSRNGDVAGIERLTRRALRDDDRYGRKRPREMASLLAAVDTRLASARERRLAQDRWAVRAPIINRYARSVAVPLDTLRSNRAALLDVKRLAGPSRGRLKALSRAVARAKRQLAAVRAPEEASLMQGLLANAIQLAARAADARRQAVASGDMQTAWQASSAAAGALLLLDRAVDELRAVKAGPLAVKH